MANAAGGAHHPGEHHGGAVNPFQIATNLYAEKNVQGLLTSQQLGTSPIPVGGAVNAGQYLRGVRIMIRTVTPGVGGTATNDGTLAIGSQVDLTNVDGSEILYNMGSYSHYLVQKYGRPWIKDPITAYDYQTGNSPSVTLFLQPEIRFTAGVLANTDTRSQYRFDFNLAAASAIASGYTTNPTISLTPYMDAWAQPDDKDLQGTANQPVPPGVNLQIKRRHQIFTLNANGSDNTMLSTLTGNAIRVKILVFRDSSGNRQDGASDPFYWQLDNRSLGKLNPDIIRQWADDFYHQWNMSTRETGVYVFPRFMDPGSLTGQGWLYTANSTKDLFETSTSNNAATAELITDEVYPVGDVDPMLVDI